MKTEEEELAEAGYDYKKAWENAFADNARLRALILEGEWAAGNMRAECLWCGALEPLEGGQPWNHYDDCRSFSAPGVVR